MRPPSLRLQALQLMQLMLEDATLAQLFEGGLREAAAARGEPGPPTATAGTSGSGEGGDTSSTPGRAAAPGGGGGVQPMQADAGEPVRRSATFAAQIVERLLDSFVLDDALQSWTCWSSFEMALPPPAGTASSSGGGGSSSGGGGSSRAVAATTAAAAAGEPACSGTTVARAAMQLVATLRERRQRGILSALLLDDACGAPGCMLAQRLMQLAETALALPGEEAALQLLCPLPWPEGAGAARGTTLLHQQADWQQRLRVAQEALTLLRGLLVDSECSESAWPGRWAGLLLRPKLRLARVLRWRRRPRALPAPRPQACRPWMTWPRSRPPRASR